jgi:ATP-dependent DNA helicase
MSGTEPTSKESTPGTSPDDVSTPDFHEIVDLTVDKKVQRLNFLVERSKIYASILSERLASSKSKLSAVAEQEEDQQPPKKKRDTKKVKKEKKNSQRSILSYIKETGDSETTEPTLTPHRTLQPRHVTGGILHAYQLAGVEWMMSLFENGLNGILADEMGLGKTVQVIAFLAHLLEHDINGPFLIVAPLSTIQNWKNEFARFAPSIDVVKYHGTPVQRATLRAEINRKSKNPPIIVTSYEIIINDCKHLGRYDWKYIIVDEGHRLKNMNCRLIKQLKKFKSANRMLLTGTPLQNNLSELWSLLNFLLPDIFSDLELFQAWFENAGADVDDLGETVNDNLIQSLHAILRPFLLRRLKVDVSKFLPDKREYVIYGGLTNDQTELYKRLLNRSARDYVVEKILEARGHKTRGAQPPEHTAKRYRKSVSYLEPDVEDEFESGEDVSEDEDNHKDDDGDDVTQRMVRQAARETSAKSFQNIMMQLRLVCNSPFLFYYPWTDDQTVDERIVTSSGKMILADKLARRLVAKGHKVLVFSQFTKMLDILEDWVTDIRRWKYCRIDGRTSQDDRQQQIDLFNNDDDYKIFLLSTRSGGLGINLTAADSVILFDSDWNPQQDLQAMDRVHRIGQTRPVVIYRLTTSSTVEEVLLRRAGQKRMLEQLVIENGKFKGLWNDKSQEEVIHKMETALQKNNVSNVKIGGITQRDFEIILDRSPEAYQRARDKTENLSENIATVI